MYDELVKRLRELPHLLFIQLHGHEDTVYKAADAIEELSMKLHGDEAAILGMKREIEQMVVNGTHRWIPVTERLPNGNGEYLVSGEDKVWVCEFIILGDVGGWCNSARNPCVKYWMPLPEPPEGEN